ncbi:50S ribosomal protein L30 [Loigolactobacillus coryniformis]|jgi:large subunit ribosomal protein L30|uniref:Large ribosomal subunit protein uL30 n=4 Tax=Loigolactobacillus TaxID=2767889 RepID=A0A0R1F9Q7_9LACO|nr:MULTISPECIES: 50S ribosomal protein L30 [Loigolactobacillus]MDT3391253.1 50S ribosomal protein L30 [Bacillota bacterium]OEH89829.1 50S ribosomal protein L30 [Loigolactobacillus coryniformis subsp. coryniformis]RRG06085.1 MAG: 50S ribosomal protein L30 [Lactobacillus sp.]ATO43012.1 50S ribosomal protein L30 [Loigolactobacillus coryniformis subsp. torquens DSM 20004 = KCTC 3535]ATO54764.1 50S ribosomal protein L30 [Loigolactobacillus coryniformis subsp. coryniformis KCTC 3167 = DSM 20001]
MAQLKITLKRSAAHRIPNHRAIVKSMGLSKVNSSVTLPDNEAVRGQLFKIGYLVNVEEVK